MERKGLGVQAELLRLDHLKGRPTVDMQAYVETHPVTAYDELMSHYERVRSDQHLLETAFHGIAAQLSRSAQPEDQKRLEDLRAARRSALNLVPRQFLKNVVVDENPITE